MLQPTRKAFASPLKSRLFIRVVMGLALFTPFAFSQGRDRIVQPIDSESIATLHGAVHPRAQARFDRGPVTASMKLERMQLTFKPTQAQEQDLTSFLEQLQDPASPNYHKWLTPEEYADRFGVSQNDFDKVANWLEQQGFAIVERSRSRSWIAFNGTAEQAQSAFHTQIHNYVMDGESRYANATEPSVPSALAQVVQGVRLNDFKPRARAVIKKEARPNFTSSISGNHFLAPDDFATIYDLQPLYGAGIDGTGQKLVVVGQSNITLSDLDTFRSVSNLPKNDPQIILVPGATDPGIVSGDVGEADLDLEWSGAVARNANIIYVYAKNVFDSLQYAINQNLAPIISISYGDCEANFSAAEISSLQSMGQTANAQGQTIVAASGDTGAADCDYPTGTTKVTSATHGLAVDLPASLPSVTGVGGTEFNEGSSPSTYWNTTNNASNGSAISYIPEIVWNDTASVIANGGSLSASGGGVSSQFPKPSWQTGRGVPNDSMRDVPDVSLTASANHDGYLVCSQGSCVNGYRQGNNNLTVYGGTSAGAPTFSGILALVTQKSASSLGNANASIYSLAASTPNAFHDITSGDNKVPCTAGTPDCPTGGSGYIGYTAGVGYDLASGWGSPDANNLVLAWAPTLPPNFQLFASANNLTLTHGGAAASDTITLNLGNGFSGAVNLTCTVSSTLGATTCAVSPSTTNPPGTATLTVTPPATLASLPRSHFGWEAGTSFVFLAGLWISSWTRREHAPKGRKRALWNVFFVIALIALAGAMIACGGGSKQSTPTLAPATPPPPPPQPLNGTVTVQGTSGSLTHSVAIQVTVN